MGDITFSAADHLGGEVHPYARAVIAFDGASSDSNTELVDEGSGLGLHETSLTKRRMSLERRPMASTMDATKRINVSNSSPTLRIVPVPPGHKKVTRGHKNVTPWHILVPPLHHHNRQGTYL